MKIGITERGDAGINLSWLDKVFNKANAVDGMILITKNLTESFKYNVLNLHQKGYKIIVHCTCTGYGNTPLEPNVPNYYTQLNSLRDLIQRGFPAENCVLRIDPIFPSENGVAQVAKVLDYFTLLNTGVTRIRVSIVDEYKHVKERYREHGWEPLYGSNLHPSEWQVKLVADLLNRYPFRYEMCAENLLATKLSHALVIGCVSSRDSQIMNIPTENISLNPQQRSGCHCLSCKTELLTEKKRCPHQCVYCFWKD